MCEESNDYNNKRKSVVDSVLEAAEYMVPTNTTKTIYNSNIIHAGEITDSVNWRNTLGQSEIKIKAIVNKQSSNVYSATIIFNVVDFYDWDNTITNMGKLPVSPQELWELHHAGVAKHFLTKGASKLQISWKQGQRWDKGANVNILGPTQEGAY